MQVCCGTGDPNGGIRSAGIVPYRRGDTADADVKFLVINRKPAFSRECEVRLQPLRLDDGLRRMWFESFKIRSQLAPVEIGEQGFPDGCTGRRGYTADRDINGDSGGTALLANVERSALSQDHEVGGEAGFLGELTKVRGSVITHIEPSQ